MSFGARRFRGRRKARQGAENSPPESAEPKPAGADGKSPFLDDLFFSRRQAEEPAPPPSPAPAPAAARRGPLPGGRRAWPPDDLFAIGAVTRPHGIRGEMRLYPYTRTAEEFAEKCPDEVTLWRADGSRRAVRIESLAVHQGMALAAFEGVETREEAEALRGAFVCLPESQRWELGEDEFFVDDLAGLTLVDALSGAEIGAIERVADGAAHDYLVVRLARSGEEALVPFIRQFVVAVDLEARRVAATLPEGLLEVNRPGGEPDDAP